jgi:hypothetical protein
VAHSSLLSAMGSVSVIIGQGVTGGIVDTMDEAVMMLPRVMELDPRAVRRRFEQRFSSILMATDYVAVYRSLPAVHIGARDDCADVTTGIAKKLNGQGLNGDRAYGAAATDARI